MSLVKLKKLWKQEDKLKKKLNLVKGEEAISILKQLHNVQSQIKKLI